MAKGIPKQRAKNLHFRNTPQHFWVDSNSDNTDF